ncbi:MAG: phage tail tape measure C-terminal domain-containing protein [Paracoccaceae bacterium]|jgi:lambda family phage tail tape measure protein|nr:phage tail tape measure C-terminal domain-containing protein [Paracoccaceae bacterium]MDP7187038.1 phage tail tape measure C-terminal domain-containing protein [Paracoccaceae bacterium]
MPNKQVSVRLTASGGDQVRRELKGVGSDGEKAFRKTSREVERANARLAGFARRVKVTAVAAASAAAVGAVAATRSAMERAFEVQRQAQLANADPEQFQGWAAGAEMVGIKADKLSDILKDMNDRVGDFLSTGGGPMKDFFEQIAPKVGVTADQFAKLSGPDALQLYVSSLEKAGVNQQEMTFFLEAMASDATALLPLLREGGAEMSTLAQRAAELGVVMDQKTIAGLVRSRTALVAMGQAITGVGNRIGAAVAPILEKLANAFVALASATSPLSRALDGALGHLERLVTYGVTAAGIFGTKLVAALALSAARTIAMAGALKVLRGALVRTGIGALIVGAGELVFWFGKLVRGAGGFGDALSLLNTVAGQVFERLLAKTAAWVWDMRAGWRSFKAEALWMFLGVIDGATDLANTLVNTMQGTVKSIAVIWQDLPRLLGSAIYAGVNAVQQGLGAMLNWSIDKLNGFLARVNGVTDKLPDWARADWMVLDPLESVAIKDIANPFEGVAADTAAAIQAAFAEAFSEDVFSPTNSGLIEDILNAEAGVEAAREIANAWAGIGNQPITAWKALKDAVTDAGKTGEEALAESAAVGARLTAALGNAGDVADKTREKLAGWAAVRDGLKSFVETAKDWGNGLKQALTGAFSSAESAFRSFVNTGKFDFKSLVRSILADLAVLSFRRAVLAPIANALFGGFGGGSNLLAGVAHSGAIAGLTGSTRSVPALAFAGAPQMHSGGAVGTAGQHVGLRPDEVPAILQRGERVLSRRETAAYGQGAAQAQAVTIHVDARGAQAGVAEEIAHKLEEMLPAVRRIARDEVSVRLGRGYKL